MSISSNYYYDKEICEEDTPGEDENFFFGIWKVECEYIIIFTY